MSRSETVIGSHIIARFRGAAGRDRSRSFAQSRYEGGSKTLAPMTRSGKCREPLVEFAQTHRNSSTIANISFAGAR